MLKIRLDDVDKLYEIATELGAITYLQGLLEYDNDDKIPQSIRKFVPCYLLDRQTELVMEFYKMLNRTDFCMGSDCDLQM